MKKSILAAAMLFAAVGSAQEMYVSLNGGATSIAGPKVLLKSSGLTGSYGEGLQSELRVGYKITKEFAVDLGVGYLYGKSQQIANNDGLILSGRGKAFGATLAGVYNFHKNLYVRAGLLTKIAGSTTVRGSFNADFPVPAPAPAGTMAPLDINLTRTNNGKFSLGFVAAAGVKFDLGHNLSLFAELDYQGINVKANKSSIGDFNATLGGQAVPLKNLQAGIKAKIDETKAAMASIPSMPIPDSYKAAAMAKAKAGITKLYSLGGLVADEVTYSDSEDTKATMTERPSTLAPYSSLGGKIGIIYSFDLGGKK